MAELITVPRATVEQVLGALEGGGDSWRLIGPAIDALRAVMEQPTPDKCPTCGSDCNERDELEKAEREIERLRDELEQPERPNLLGWYFHRNSDGSIGIKSPPPRPGESKRTSESVYPNDGGGLHELLSKFVDHINALEQPEQATVKESLTTGEPPKFEAVPYPEVQPYPFEMPPLTPEQLARVSAGMRALKLTMTEVEQPEQAEPVVPPELEAHFRHLDDRVTWGVDWGTHGDQSCCTIIKVLPDGVREVVAVEYGPPYHTPQQVPLTRATIS